MWRRWGTWEFLFWHLLMSFEKPKKSEFWENEKNCWIYHHFTHVYQKPQPYEIQFLRYRVRQSFWTFPPPPLCALPLPPSKNPENQNFEKRKKASGQVIVLNLCNKKARSNDVCLLRYGVRQTYLFVILGHFLLFYHTVYPKN